MPSANGVAEVNSKRGSIAIEAEFGDLQKPTTFGNEYLTYVLWAISPEGRAVNLGEVLLGGNHRSKLNVTTDLQAFALIVTAEPYYAVRQPSNVVVLENVVREDTKGTTEAVNAKYELMERGGLHSHRLQVRSRGSECQVAAWNSSKREMHCASLNPREPNSTPPDSYQHAVELMDKADGECHRQAHRQKAADRSFPRSSADRGRCTRDRSQENG